MSDITDATLGELAEAVRTGKRSSLEATEACLARIARLDARLRAFITVDADGARATARARDEERARGALRGPLHGVPVALKDLFHVGGLPTSCGTATPEYFRSELEATVVTRLRDAGAVILGKLNMTELALGPFGDNAHHGDAQNPWRSGHAPGGSSSGSGVAVAAGLAFGTLGSDTGGSIRLPAACCGIVGLKPTYGRVSRAGVMPLSWSLDHIGPMARTVRDVATLLGVIAGRDRHDATTSHRRVPDVVAALERPVGDLRVGVPENYYFDGVDGAMAAAVHAAAREMAAAGAQVTSVRLPDPTALVDVANILARCESAVVHARLVRERPHELQPVVRGRLEPGFHISAHDYLQAGRLRARLARHFVTEVFEEVDVLAVPVIPEPAPALAETKRGTVDEVVRRMSAYARLTRPFNALGLPALALPCGVSPDGLPLALQLVGRPFDEATVLALGHAYERRVPWAARRPAL